MLVSAIQQSESAIHIHSNGEVSSCNAGGLGWEDPLEEGMATHSSIPAWKIPTDRGAGWAAVHGAPRNQTQLSN